jgi:hypothetical protein
MRFRRPVLLKALQAGSDLLKGGMQRVESFAACRCVLA